MTNPTNPQQPLSSDNPVWQEIIDHIEDPAPETIEGIAAAVRAMDAAREGEK